MYVVDLPIVRLTDTLAFGLGEGIAHLSSLSLTAFRHDYSYRMIFSPRTLR